MFLYECGRDFFTQLKAEKSHGNSSGRRSVRANGNIYLHQETKHVRDDENEVNLLESVAHLPEQEFALQPSLQTAILNHGVLMPVIHTLTPDSKNSQ
jgi:hypothetical protein